MDTQHKKQLRVFTYGLPLILFFLGIRHGVKHSWDILSALLIIFGTGVVIIALVSKPLLEMIFRYWMKGAQAIGFIFFSVMLMILYYGMFFPGAMILRLMGKDFMQRSWDLKAKSYWQLRDRVDEKDPNIYTNQF